MNVQNERIIHKEIAKFLDYIGVLYCSTCQGNKLSIKQGALFKSLGYKKGFPDIFIYEPRGKYHGMAIELKASGGKITTEQLEWSEKLTSKGYYSVIMKPKFKTNAEVIDVIENIINIYLHQNNVEEE